MTRPLPNATPEEMAALDKLNKKLYGEKTVGKPAILQPSDINDPKSIAKRKKAEEMQAEEMQLKMQAEEMQSKTQNKPVQPPAPRPGIVPPKVNPEELQQMRLKRDQGMKVAEQSRLNAQALQQKADQMRQTLPVKTGAPPMPVKPAPRVITDPVRPTPTPAPMPAAPSTAPMSAVRGPFNTPDGNFDASKAPPLPPGAVYKKGGKVASTSRRGDGIAQRGKTKGKYI